MARVPYVLGSPDKFKGTLTAAQAADSMAAEPQGSPGPWCRAAMSAFSFVGCLMSLVALAVARSVGERASVQAFRLAPWGAAGVRILGGSRSRTRLATTW